MVLPEFKKLFQAFFEITVLFLSWHFILILSPGLG